MVFKHPWVFVENQWISKVGFLKTTTFVRSVLKKRLFQQACIDQTLISVPLWNAWERKFLTGEKYPPQKMEFATYGNQTIKVMTWVLKFASKTRSAFHARVSYPMQAQPFIPTFLPRCMSDEITLFLDAPHI